MHCSKRSIGGGSERAKGALAWDISIFFIHYTYGIDAESVTALDSTVSTEERDSDGFYAVRVHSETTFNYLTCVP